MLATTAALAPHPTKAQTCPMPAAMGPVSVNHAVCQPAGIGICTGNPKKPGRDGFPCAATGVQGGVVRGTCISGCCSVVAPSTCTVPEVTESQGAIEAAASLLDPQTLMQMLQGLQGLMQGGQGGAGGGSGGMPSIEYRYGEQTEEEHLLEFDSTDTVTDEQTQLLFNELGTGETPVQQEHTSEEPGVLDDTLSPDDTPGTTNDASGQEGESVSTTIEERLGGRDAGISGGDDIALPDGGDVEGDRANADLVANTNLNTNVELTDADIRLMQETGLTLAELEAQGLLQAQRRGFTHTVYTTDPLTVPYESLTPAEIRSLQERSRSAFAVSGGFLPFDSPANDAQEPENAGFFARVVAFFAGLFGIAPAGEEAL